jgi:predicted nucleic acid-binding protein
MTGRSFFDTNVLVYTDDRDSADKQRKALEVYSECRRRRLAVVSTQVLQEYFVTVTRKLGVEIGIARRKVEIFGRADLAPIRLEDILGAVDLQRLHGFDFRDALIVRSAFASGCARLYTEDFKHGQRIDSVEIVNPFL